MKQLIFAIATIVCLAITTLANAQDPQPISQKEVKQSVESLIQQMNDNYIFPEVAKEAENMLRNNLKKGAYKHFTDGKKLAEKLTSDLRTLVKDRHLGVYYHPVQKNEKTPDADAQKTGYDAWWHRMSRQNFGFPKAEILEGNIGYLKVIGFGPVDKVGPTCSAAVSFLANTDAMIIDLRHNGGGEPALVQYLVSHFFEGSPIHINDIVYRKDNKVEEYWTLPNLNATRYLNKPVYILTDSRTFSGGEEFAYDMQVLKRATLIGETTGGGANPGDEADLGNGFHAFIPNGRAVNPVTKTNWEGTGVTPDISVKAEAALKEAHVMALQKLSAGATNAEIKSYFEKSLDAVKQYDGREPLLAKE